METTTVEETVGQKLPIAAVEYIQAKLFGSAKVLVKQVASNVEPTYMTVKANEAQIRAAYDVLSPLYEKEFNMTLLEFAMIEPALRDGFESREVLLLKKYLISEQKCVLSRGDSGPSIEFAINPPSRLYIADVATL